MEINRFLASFLSIFVWTATYLHNEDAKYFLRAQAKFQEDICWHDKKWLTLVLFQGIARPTSVLVSILPSDIYK